MIDSDHRSVMDNYPVEDEPVQPSAKRARPSLGNYANSMPILCQFYANSMQINNDSKRLGRTGRCSAIDAGSSSSAGGGGGGGGGGGAVAFQLASAVSAGFRIGERRLCNVRERWRRRRRRRRRRWIGRIWILLQGGHPLFVGRGTSWPESSRHPADPGASHPRPIPSSPQFRKPVDSRFGQLKTPDVPIVDSIPMMAKIPHSGIISWRFQLALLTSSHSQSLNLNSGRVCNPSPAEFSYCNLFPFFWIFFIF